MPAAEIGSAALGRASCDRWRMTRRATGARTPQGDTVELSDSRPGGIRDRVERGFEAWGRFACRRPRAIVAAMLVVSALLFVRLPTLETDTSTDSFLHPNDPIRVAYDQFRRDFGRDERITVAIEAPDLFAPEFLERLRAFHRDLEREVPHVEDMTSLVNARDTRGEGDELIVEDLLERWPETPAQRARVRERALANPLYRNTLISRDRRVTAVSIQLVTYAGGDAADELGGFDDEAAAEPEMFLSEADIYESIRVAREVVRRHEAEGFRLRMAGGPVMAERLNVRMQEDMGRFTLLCLAAIALFLFVLFRRVAAVVLPLLVVGLSMLATLGVMALLGAKLSVATQILPSFLLAVGVCDAVHILSVYYQRLEAGDGVEQALPFTLGHSGLAILMTSLTTAGGLASFAIGELKPVAELGIYAPFGVMFAFVYTVLLLPALLALIPTRPRRRSHRAGRVLTAVLQRLGDFAATHPGGVVSVTVALLVVCALGISFLRFSHDPIRWLPEGEDFREATLFMNKRLDGVNVVEVLVDTGRENGVHEPEFLDRLEAVRRETARIHQGEWHIGKSLSVVDVVKEIHQALNENRPEFHAVPRERALVAQELLLFENAGADDLEDVVDPTFRTARVTLRVPWLDAMVYPALLDDLRSRLERVLGDAATLEITGLVPVLSQTFRAMLSSMVRSYLLALLIIAPLMVLLIGQLRRGLLSTLPNLAPVIAVLGYMGWAGIYVDGLTMMVGAIVIGLAVDDTIHFMHNFRRYLDQTGDPREAIHRTLATTGRALLVTSLVLAGGFFTFAGAYVKSVQVFGLLSGAAVLVAFLSNVVLAPSLMVLATGRRTRRESPAGAPDSGHSVQGAFGR